MILASHLTRVLQFLSSSHVSLMVIYFLSLSPSIYRGVFSVVTQTSWMNENSSSWIELIIQFCYPSFLVVNQIVLYAWSVEQSFMPWCELPFILILYSWLVAFAFMVLWWIIHIFCPLYTSIRSHLYTSLYTSPWKSPIARITHQHTHHVGIRELIWVIPSILLILNMDEPIPRGLTLEQAYDERQDHAIRNLHQKIEQVFNLLEIWWGKDNRHDILMIDINVIVDT